MRNGINKSITSNAAVLKKYSGMILLYSVILILFGGVLVAAATETTNNNAPARYASASATNVLVMDYTITVGADTSLAGIALAAGSAISYLNPAGWTTVNFYDGGGIGWQPGTDWIGTDDDSDGVYTSAADVLYVNGSDVTPSAGTTLYDIVVGDNVCSNNHDLASAYCVYIDNEGYCDEGTEDIILKGDPFCSGSGDVNIVTGDNWAATDDVIGATTDIYKENVAGELTYSAAADTKLAGTDPAAGTAISLAPSEDWSTVHYYDAGTGAWEAGSDWIGTDSDSNNIYLDQLNAITAALDGGATISSEEILNVKFWLDDGDSSFEPGTGDTDLGTASYDAGSGWYIKGLTQALAGGANRIFVAANLNDADNGDIIKFALQAASGTAPFSEGDDDAGLYLASTILGGITNANTQTVDAANPTSAAVIANAQYGPNTWVHATSLAGTAADTSGIASVTITIQRSGDNAYWTGTEWGASTPLAVTGTTSWTYTIDDTNFGNGVTYTVTPTATDNVSNSADGTPDSFVYDNAASTVAVTAPAVDTLVRGTATFTFTSSEPGTQECNINGGDWESCASLDAFSTLSAFAGLGEVQFTLNVRDTDAFGNIGTASRTFIKDTTQPTIYLTSVSPTSGNTAKIGDSVVVTLTEGHLETGLTASGDQTINSVTSVFEEVGLGVYTITYTVVETNNNILDSEALPVNIKLKDTAGNNGTEMTTISLGTAPGIDANRPTASSATFNANDNNRQFVITFNEAIDATTAAENIDLTKVFVRTTGSAAGGVVLTGATVTETDGTAITITTTEAQRVAIQALATRELDIDAGAFKDVAGNTILADTDNAIEYTADTNKPTITTLTVNDTMLTEADAGADQFTVTIDFSETMITDGSRNPGLDWANAEVSETLDCGGSWSDSNTYVYSCTVIDAGYEPSNINIKVTSARDTAQNQMITDTKSSVFSIDMRDPTVSYVYASPSTGHFTTGGVVDIIVQYSENVNVSGTPTIGLNSGGTASYFSGNGTSDITFRYTVGAAESNVDLSYVNTSSLVLNGGTIQDKVDHNATNTLTPSVADFKYYQSIVVDTSNPTVETISVNDASLAESDVGTDHFMATIHFIEAMTVGTAPTITFDPTVASTLSGCTGAWDGNDTYNYTCDVADGDVTLTGVDIDVSGAKDYAGNTMADDTSTGDNKFNIDTAKPLVSVVSPTVVAEANVGVVTVDITFNEAMTQADNTVVSVIGITGSPVAVAYGSWQSTTKWRGTFTLADNDETITNAYYSIAGSKDAAGNNLTAIATRGLNNALNVDTVKPTIGAVNVNDASLVESDAVENAFVVAIDFSEAMDSETHPTVAFDPAVATTLTNCGGVWSDTDTYTYTCDVADANITLADVDIDVSGANDAAVNTMSADTTSGTDKFDIDTVKPTISGLNVNDASLIETDAGENEFAVTIDFSETMDGGTAPTVSFDPAVATTLTNCGGTWSDTDTYTYTCDVADANVTQADVDIDVSAAKDAAGNTMSADTTSGTDKFDIDTVKPTITGLNVNDASLVESDAGENAFAVTINFSEVMDGGTAPTVSFDPAVATTLTNCGGVWSDTDTYTYTCDVADVNVTQADVDIDVSAAKDAAGNIMSADILTGADKFDIDTVKPTISGLNVNDGSLIETDAGENAFAVTIDFSETMDGGTAPTVSFDPAVATTLTNCGGVWSDTDTYTYTCDVADVNVTQADVDIDVSGAKGAAGNTMSADTTSGTDKFDIDTVKPTIGAVNVNDASLVESDAGENAFVVAIDFSEAMDGETHPTVAFDPAVATTLTNCGGVWSDTDTYTYTCDVADANITLADVDIDVSGANDAAVNTMSADTTSGTDKFDIDTVKPTISGLNVNDASLIETDAGENEFAVTIDFSETMDGDTSPIVEFDPAVATTLTNCGGTWSDTDTYTYTCDVADANVTQADVDIDVSAAKDAAGNTMSADILTGADKFDIDTVKPTISGLNVNDASLIETDAGENAFAVTIDFAETMDGDTAPTVVFDPAVATTLTNCGGVWSDTDTYTYTCDVADVNVTQADVDIDVSGAKDAAGNTMSADTTSGTDKFDIDTVKPTISGLNVNDASLIETDAGVNAFAVTINFTESMYGETSPTITFDPEVATTLTNCNGTWSDTDTYTYTCDVADANITQADVDIDVSGAKDAAGNTMAADILSGVDKFDIDTVKPTISGLNVNDASLIETDAGENAFAVTINFTESMYGETSPTITFDPEVATTLTNCGGVWSDTDTYTYTCDVADANVTLADVDIDVSGAKDAAGNTMSADTTSGADKFDINTVKPTISVLNVNDASLIETDVGENEFIVTINFSVAMDNLTSPVISFEPVVASTLTNCDGTWFDTDTYTYTCDVADANVTQTDVDIDVSGAKDIIGNTMSADTTSGADKFDIDTVKPTITGLNVNDASLIETDAGENEFAVTIDFSEAMDGETSPTVAFDPAVATTVTNCDGTWSDTDTYTYTCDVADANVTQADVDVDVSEAKDAAGNTMSADTTSGEDKFDIDTVKPTITGLNVNDASLIETDAGENEFAVTIDFSETMDGDTSPTVEFDPAVATTLTNCGGIWSDNDTYTYTCDVADANITRQVTYVDIDVSSAKDAAGNTMSADTTSGEDKFDIDTVKPTITGLNVNDASLVESDAGENEFAVTIDFSETMDGDTSPTVAFDPAVATTLTNCGGVWSDTDTYTYTCDVADANVTQADVDVDVSDAKDAAGNTMAADILTGVDKFDIDTVNPTVELSDNHADLIVKDSNTVVITATFSENMTSAPTISIDVSTGEDADLTTEAMSAGENATTWTYSWDVPAGHSADTATVIVAGIDLAGNAYAGLTTIVYIIDNIAPTVVLSDDHADSVVRNADTVTITATFTEADQINETTVPRITIHSDNIVNNQVMIEDSNLVWTYEWNVPAGNDGNHTVSIVAYDRAGNANEAATGQTIYDIDNTDPTSRVIIASTYYGPNSWVEVSTIVGNSSDENSGVAAVTITIQRDSDDTYWDGNSWEVGPTNLPVTSGTTSWAYTLAVANLDNAVTYTVTPTATDVAGNSAAGTADSFIYDTTSPDIYITDPAAGSTVSSPFQLAIDTDGSMTGCEYNEGLTFAYGEGTAMTLAGTSYYVTLSLANGNKTYYVVCSDAADNTLERSRSFTVLNTTEDSAAPAGLAVTAPSDATSTSASSYEVTGTITADTDSVTITIYNDSDNDAAVDVGETALETVVLTPTQTTWSLDVTLAVGVNNFVVIAEDEHNNVAAGVNVPTLTRTSDSAAPAGLAVTAPWDVVSTTVSSYEVTGTITADTDSVTITIYNDSDNDAAVDVGETALETVVLTPTQTTWSMDVTLAIGANNFVVIAEDEHNNVAVGVNVPTLTRTIDSAAPAGLTVTAPSDATSTSASSYEVTGTITADTDSVTITIYNDSDNDAAVDVGETALETVVLTPTQTTWSMDVTLAVGVNNFVVIAEDEHNNVAAGVNVPAITRTSDSAAPAGLAVTAPSDATSTSASSYEVTGTITADTDSVTITIYNDSDNDAAVDVGETALETVVLTPTQTTWSLDVTLAVGVNNFVVIAEDEHNNVAVGVNVPTLTRTIDSAAPAGLTVTAPSDVVSTSASSYEVTGTITADTDSVTITIYNDADNDAAVDVGETALETVVLTPTQTTWSMDVTLAIGANNFVVIAEDEHNNVAAGVNVPTLTRTIDSAAPAGLTVTAPSDATSTSASSYEVTGTITADTDSVTITIYNDSDNDAAVDVGETALETVVLTPTQTTWSLDVTLAVGVNNFVVIAEDEHNNVAAGVNVPTLTRTIDSDDPAGLAITTPDATVNSDSYTIAGTLTADTDDVTIQVLKDGTEVVGTVVVTAGQTTWSVVVSLAQGVENIFIARATDASENDALSTSNENESKQNAVITEDAEAGLDLTPPPAPVITTEPATVNSNSYAISGTAAADVSIDTARTIILYKGGTVVGTVVLPVGETEWSMTVALTQNTTNVFTAYSRDVYGNMGNASSSVTITESSGDITPPTLTLTSAIATQITVPVIFASTEDGTASIRYGLTTSYGSQTDWMPMVTPGANTITLTGLTCGTTYHYEIYARDNLSNEGTLAGNNNFTTAACTPDETAPEIDDVEATSITDTDVTIVSTITDDTSAKVKVWIEFWVNGTETSEFTPVYNYNSASTTAIFMWDLTPNTLYLYKVHALDYAENEATSAEGNFTTLEIPQYKFEMPDNANGFPALSFARWIGNYELRNIVGFSSMNLAQFLTASEGDNKLVYEDVDNAYVYDSDGNWTVLANNEFTTWDFGNHNVGFIGYYVLDLSSSGLRKFVRHLTGPDQTAPTFTVLNGAAEGPVKTDTINITIIGASTGYYGFSTDATCNSSDTIATAFTSNVAFAVAGDHTDYFCVKSTDASANTGYHTVGQLNTDNTAPTVGVVVADDELKAGETSLVTFTFSEAVTGFTNADLTIANGLLTAVSSEDDEVTWTATFTPTADVEDATNVIAVIKTGLTDVAGNAGVGTTNSNNYEIDTLRPSVEIEVANDLMKVGDTSDVTFTFSEAVTEFTNADIDLTNANGLLSDVTSEDNIIWTATFTPSNATDATNNITVANTGVTDAAGNTGLGTTDSNNYELDNTAPTVEVVIEDTSITFGETSIVTFTFSEEVTGFTNADIDLTNASGELSDVTSEDDIVWTATYTPIPETVDETNLISVVNTGVADEAGNAGVGTTDSNNYTVDTTGEPV